ncbi:LPS-assembly protein [Novosphingobium sp. PhB165]|uniref:LPS-assembly protein LptD n=1 Tax=Novosphingobium sp. PhB165 TaxID=2485105 RepID=UPI001052CF95|nr:LPS assembly protein LptD [Novosphingobium sp. PhB165]TCM14986.1 LPS-assembly protein [Novosphingobium sp. PhB165]
MLPAAPTLLHARKLRLHHLPLPLLAAGFVSLSLPCTAFAQDLSRQVDTGPIQGAPPAPPPATADLVPVAFEADTVEYDEHGETVTAKGNVVLRKDKQSVRADTVTWNRTTGQIVGTGNVRVVDQNGNQVYSDHVELTDELKTGAMENLLLVLREGARLAANKGERLANGDVVLQHAAYSGCAVSDDSGCPKSPTWRVLAKSVIYSEDKNLVRFSDARLELFGKVQIPLFGMSVSTNGGAVSGFLVPDFRSSPSNGIEVAQPYYWKIAPNRDLTGTLHVYTEAAPMASFEYRALTDKGAYQITGYATSSNKIPIDDTNPDPNRERSFRGYIFANGRFQLDEGWSVTASIRRATDRTFLRRYDISRDDRLRSSVEVEHIDEDSYFSFAGYATQTMRSGQDQGLMPVAIPVIDYRRRFDESLLGGKIETQVNTMGITRVDGQDTQRAFASAQWSLRKVTGMGQEVVFTGLVRGDVYHSDENDTTTTVAYQGMPGWQSRAIALAAVDVKWPLVGQVFGGTQVLTPRVQLVATPSIKNLEIPNEDSRAIELEDTNLFSLNRFPGYDRFEDGVRVTYGFDWMFERPRWRIKSTLGQSVRLSNDQSILPDGTGLSDKTSDIVGRTEIRYRNFVSLIHRFRLDKDNLAVRRNEVDLELGSNQTYFELGYTKLNRDVTENIEDLQNREEVRAAGRVAFANYWSMFGSAVVNLTNHSEDPIYGSDGFQPLRTRFGVAYEDDCLEIALTWRRDYVSNGDARKGNSFALHFALKNIGVH